MNTNFPEHLTTILTMSGMSQMELAAKTGLTQAAISRYMHGVRTPRIEHVLSMAHALNVTTDSLIDNKPVVSPLELESQFLKLDTDGQQEVARFITNHLLSNNTKKGIAQ